MRNRKRVVFVVAVAAFTLGMVGVGCAATSMSYGDVALSGGYQAGSFPHVWDLTACDMTVSFTYDGNGMVDEFGGSAHAWAELGVRQVGKGDFNPNNYGVWLATDYEWRAGTFNPDPVGAPLQDLDDKLILQRQSGQGEGAYSLPVTPPNPWANHGVWFDRDGVDPWQALMWGAINGSTYNTMGLYDVVISLHATGPGAGTAYMTVNGQAQGFYAPWRNGPPQVTPAGMTWTGDMAHLQVFYGMYGYGATHSATFSGVTVNGCLLTLPATIDVKPGSYPNSINLGSKGVLPVALLAGAGLDLETVDATTVTFAGAAAQRWVMEDVDGDGDLDMLFHFRTKDLGLTVSSTTGSLSGLTTIGQPFQGSDSVRIVRGT